MGRIGSAWRCQVAAIRWSAAIPNCAVRTETNPQRFRFFRESQRSLLPAVTKCRIPCQTRSMKGASESASVPIELTRFENGVRQELRKDVVAAEEPLEIRVEGQTISIVMRTPGQDRELVAGFLLSEGVIKSAKDVFDITTCVAQNEKEASNVIDAALVRPESFDVARFSRHVITSSSCGLCGATSIESILKIRESLTDEWRIAPEILFSLPAQLTRRQETFRSTGGLHACALFDLKGRFLALREDVGRHNALDKLIGWALLEKRTPLREHLVLLQRTRIV